MRNIILIALLVVTPIVCCAQDRSWRELTDQAFKLYKEKQYEKAIEVTKGALQVASEKYGAESLKAAESIGNLGALYDIQGKEDEAKPLFEQARAIREKHGKKGTPLGLQTEAHFDKALKLKQKLPAGLQSMEDTSLHCDFDSDGDCDDNDLAAFRTCLGSCVDYEKGTFDKNYHPLADIDGDGCVTATDQYYLFEDIDYLNSIRDKVPKEWIEKAKKIADEKNQ